jgi:hypothetical protein
MTEIKPIVKYQHAFKNTYLYGSFYPINGDTFVYKIEEISGEIFYKYLHYCPVKIIDYFAPLVMTRV